MILNLIEVLVFSSLLLLSFILVTNPMKVNIKANRWFGWLLLLWASYWFDEVYSLVTNEQIQISTFFVVAFIQFFTPLLFFISVCHFTTPAYKLKKDLPNFLILPFVYLLILISDKFLPANLYLLQLIFVLIHALLFTTLSFIRIRKHQSNIQQFASSTQEINLNWLEYIILAMISLVFIVGVFNIVFFELPLNVFMNAMVLLVVLFITYNSLKQKEIFPKNNVMVQQVIDINEEIEEVPKRQIVTDNQMEELKYQLDELMMRDEPYLNSELNLIKLAELLGVTSHQLSYVINQGYNENFFQFVNRFRVEKAKLMLSDKENNKLSILGVAFESGFSSKTSFNTTFKKLTEQTPSEYKKKCSGL
ncbi:helix-turn-helix domain-containing protein [Carboxylicivirga marina]|uniref:AraC family transcriptional regulator n=1 Tax=Carboxylicivirga marina TaxID=2800988 RepID=A0ABS1HPF7_9BACT|nr:helix-turn-helix domain-containing protein [Carboxylicivirga marina]MBK3519118.1 AraC family transcriptional regulator [Carboxylicivirga marina]